MQTNPQARRLSQVTEVPKPPPELAARAAKAGARLVAYDPKRVRHFVEGRITLGDLEGIGKDEQYEMARVGYAQLEQNQLEEARTVFRGLLALDPYDAYFLTALGVIAQREGDFDKADEYYSRALEINPFSSVALSNRGEVRLLLGRLVEAADDLVRAVSEDPELREPSTRRARALIETVRSELGSALS